MFGALSQYVMQEPGRRSNALKKRFGPDIAVLIMQHADYQWLLWLTEANFVYSPSSFRKRGLNRDTSYYKLSFILPRKADALNVKLMQITDGGLKRRKPKVIMKGVLHTFDPENREMTLKLSNGRIEDVSWKFGKRKNIQLTVGDTMKFMNPLE